MHARAPHYPADPSPPVRITALPDGRCLYDVDAPPSRLPPVARRDLDRAWHEARQAALAGRPGAPRGFTFRRPEGGDLSLALTDRDARCWAAAVERRAGLSTRAGISLLLRLLALVDLLARAPWLQHIPRGSDGADLPVALLAAAATVDLTDDARFDETALQSRLQVTRPPGAARDAYWDPHA